MCVVKKFVTIMIQQTQPIRQLDPFPFPTKKIIIHGIQKIYKTPSITLQRSLILLLQKIVRQMSH